MKIILALIAFLVSLSYVGCTNISKTKASDTIADALNGFDNPQDSARTKVWWFHGETETTKEGITADLEAYKKAGVGGVVYYDQVHGKGENALPGFSPQWWEMLRFSAEEAERIGLSFEINISNGFVAGGSWIDDEHSMKHLVASETLIKGGKRFEGQLQASKNRYNFYRDVVVLAFPAHQGKGESSRTKPFKASSNIPIKELDNIFDANTASYTNIPAQGTGNPVYINMEFEEEFTARSFTYTVYAKGKSTAGAMNVPEPTQGEFKGLGYKPYPNFGQLEVSSDGVNYTKVCDFTPIYRDPMTFEQKTVAFAPVKGKFYRLNLHDWWLESLVMPQGDVSKNSDTDLRLAKLMLSSTAKLSHWEDKAGFYSDPALVDNDVTPVYSLDEAIDSKTILNITDKMDADGVLRWDAPAGDWFVMRFGYVPTGAPNKHGRKNLMGRETDRLSVKAAEYHWANYPQRIIDSLKVTGSGNLVGVIMDSHEAGSQTWTDDFIEQFIKRQGYDPTLLLPAMMGYVVDDVEKSKAFLYDIRRNIADMMTDNFFGTFQRLCTQNGLTLTAQAIGNGLTITGDPMQAKAVVDKGQGEFWGHHPNGNYDIKESSSAAHMYGKSIASAEAFTDVSFSQSLGHFKMLADAAYGFGINEFVICASAYQPWLNIIPGNTGGGRHYCMNRNNTWWDYSQPFWDYQARNAYVLRQGKPYADLCLYLGENAPVKILTHRLPDIPGGYDFDAFTSYALFNRMDAANGKVILPDGVTYNMMVMPYNSNITLDALRKIASMVKNGMKLYGSKPSYSKSGRDLGKEAEYNNLANQLWGQNTATTGQNKHGQGTVYWGISLAQAIKLANMIPDVDMKEGNTKDNKIYFAHRKLDDGDIYFLDNHKNKAEDDLFTFASTGKYVQLWNSVTGERFSIPIVKQDDKTTSLHLYFNPRESYFVVITDTNEPLPVVEWYKPEGNTETITGAWDVYFDEKFGGPGNVVFDNLLDWTQSSDPKIKYYSGTAIYKKTVSLRQSNERAFIDLGDPGFVARVFVNAKEVGVVWCSPWNADITEYLLNGDNEIEIHVANSLMNRMIYDASLPENQRITYAYPVIASPNGNLVPSGLKKVKIVRIKNQ
ncbi:MAG: glycosyl hydrolase [Bacteroidales bacterium]